MAVHVEVKELPKDAVGTVATEGSKLKLSVADNNNEQLLISILTEMKKMNIQLGSMTDNIIANDDIEQ